jgi:mannose-6-phosphate isomerase
MFLFEAIALSPAEILGEKHMSVNRDSLGVLVKYLDAQEMYGLQCHPTREWGAKMFASPYGKEECWYVIGTRDDTLEPAYVLLGFKENVTRELWEEYYHKGDIKALENLCHKIYVKPGEMYYVAGGCPHALGEGCFVIEAQEPCDITVGATSYKEIVRRYEYTPKESEEFYDERLLGSYIYKAQSYDDNLKCCRPERKTIREGLWGKEEILIGKKQTAFFSMTEIAADGQVELRNTGFPQIAIVTKGNGKITYEGGLMEIKKGDEIFLPYCIPGAVISGDHLKVVFCHPEGV